MTTIADSLALPCGAVLQNRLAKAAMTEGLGDSRNRATERHVRLYGRWAGGGAGLLLTGNVQVDRAHLERAGNIAIEGPQSAEARHALEAMARAGTAGGTHLWMQISHAGRQTPAAINARPKAPSAIKLEVPGASKNFGEPVALTDEEIRDLIARFAHVARTAKETGFTGVQVHGAHGYLISTFLSPRANTRTDDWGGSLANRARFLLETVRAVRAAVGPDFPVSVKLNSADFQKGGFSHEDSLQVAEWLNAEGIDLLEISGGTYEQPRMMNMKGNAADAEEEAAQSSTARREAYFLQYAEDIRRVAKMPLMVTGGFRSREGMDAALGAGACDVIGLGRPLCGSPAACVGLLQGTAAELPAYEKRLRLGPGIFGPQSPFTFFKGLNGWGAQGWYYVQLLRLGDGQDPDEKLGLLKALKLWQDNEKAAVAALKPTAP